MKALVSVDDVLAARRLLLEYVHTLDYARSLKMTVQKPPLSLKILAPDRLGELKKAADAAVEPVEEKVTAFLEGKAREYSFVDFWLSANLPPVIALGFLETPPQLTLKRYGPALPPSRWFETFMPIKFPDGRMRSTVTGRALYSRWYIYAVLNRRLMPQPLRSLIEAKASSYAGKGYDEGRAKRLAVRDAFRAAVGSAWLVAVLTALENGEASSDEVVLPYQLAKDPNAFLHSMIDPGLLSEKYSGYTWKKLLRAVRPDGEAK